MDQKPTYAELQQRTRKLEQALHDSEKKYKLLIKNLPCIIFRGFKDFSVEFVDTKIDSLAGYDVEAFNSKNCAFARDMTERKIMHEDLLKAQKTEAIGTLAEGIAHDFNNLLSIIMGYISLAEDDIKPKVGVSEYLKEAEIAALRAQELTKQLITFSKGDEPVKNIDSIGDLVRETTALFPLRQNSVDFEFFKSDDLMLVEFDEAQMKHAIINLMANAVESMPDGGTIDVRVENINISSGTEEQNLPLSEGRYVKISVKDHGVGIPKKHLSKVFDPYFSTKEIGTQKGMGLGLATTHSIIDKHNGHIAVESETGVGSTFTIYLPAFEQITQNLDQAQPSVPAKPASLTGKILVMDDEDMIRNISKQILSRLGYEPELARDGAEAIELYKNALHAGKPFDAVVLDLTIPEGVGGKETIKSLLKIDPQAKAVVSSGYINDPVMTDFRKYGFTGALAKPYKKEDLNDVLNKVIMG